MNHNPLVSVIIPTYNRATTLATAISSVLSQTYPHFEIIVVDDGSQDDTRSIVQSFPGVQYRYQDNAGQASARNTGLTLSRGALIATLDSDDQWYPDFLQRTVEQLVAGDLDFVFANWDQEDANGQFWNFLATNIFLAPHFPKMQDGWIPLDPTSLRHVYLQGCPSPSSSLLMTRKFVSQGWNTSIKIGDDWYMLVQAIFSAPRKGAFTLDKLWKKCIDTINIYDGRKRKEVLEYLYISDLNQMLTDFKPQMTRAEYRLLQRQHIYSLVELAKHHLIREFNFIESSKLLGRSFQLDTVHTFKSIPAVISNGYRRILQDRKQKRQPE